MSEKSIVPASLVALLVDRDEAVLALLEAAEFLFVPIAGVTDADALITVPRHIVLFLAAPSAHDTKAIFSDRFLLSTIAAVMLSSEEVEVGLALTALIDQVIGDPH